jgi:hypothetical protein
MLGKLPSMINFVLSLLAISLFLLAGPATTLDLGVFGVQTFIRRSLIGNWILSRLFNLSVIMSLWVAAGPAP